MSQAVALVSSKVSADQDMKSGDRHNVNSLMLQHGIWSTSTSDRVPLTAPNKNAFVSAEGDIVSRSERSSRHASNLSVSSQQRGLTILSEDEEDVFSKSPPIKS